MNAVHVSTFDNASFAPAPLPLRTQNSGLRTAPPTAANLTLKDLIPASVRDRKFRAHSFGASLTREQRVQLFEWLGEYSLSEVQAKVGAPAPDGFGLKVHRTTLQRLRNSAENVNLSDAVIDAMDSACDVLDPEIVADAAPLRETLSLLLYARAVQTAQDASALDINRIITSIAKLDKLKAAPSRPHPIARLKVDLTVSNPQREPTLIQSISATPEPAIESAPLEKLEMNSPAALIPSSTHHSSLITHYFPSLPAPKETNPPNPVHPVHSSTDSAEIFQNCNLQTRPKSGQSGELEALLAIAKARGIDLARLDR